MSILLLTEIKKDKSMRFLSATSNTVQNFNLSILIIYSLLPSINSSKCTLLKLVFKLCSNRFLRCIIIIYYNKLFSCDTFLLLLLLFFLLVINIIIYYHRANSRCIIIMFVCILSIPGRTDQFD